MISEFLPGMNAERLKKAGKIVGGVLVGGLLTVEIGAIVFAEYNRHQVGNGLVVEQYSPRVVQIRRKDQSEMFYMDQDVKALINQIDTKCQINGQLPEGRDSRYQIQLTTGIANCKDQLS